MNKKSLLYTKKYLEYYCFKNKLFFDKINKIEQNYNILNVSYASLERYIIVHNFLINKKLLNKNLFLVDFWCYIGLYNKFLYDIWIESIWLDRSDKSIKFWNKLWITNIYKDDITNIKTLFNRDVDFICCLHVFEYMFTLSNGDNFIYNTLSEWYKILKKWGYLFFNIWEWYNIYDKNLSKYVHFEWKVNFQESEVLRIWFSSFTHLEWGYYILIK